MRGRKATLLAAAVISAVAIVVSIVSVSAAGPRATKVHVVEHADTDAVIDTGAAGDSSGDLLTFANDVYDATDTSVVGTDQGDCIRIVPGATWECRWVTVLDDGSITVEGPFSDTGSTALAITGGTGVYRDARGQMKLVYHNDAGTAFDFYFRIITG
jgi:allene oxide cyclase